MSVLRFALPAVPALASACASNPDDVRSRIIARYVGHSLQEFIADFGQPLGRAGDRNLIWDLKSWPGHCRVVLRVENRIVKDVTLGDELWGACQRMIG